MEETIKVEIDLTTDQITRFSTFLERNLTPPLIIVGVEDGVPADYDINLYDYIPVVAGQYSSANFRLKTQTQPQINFERRNINIQRMNEYMLSFVGNGLTQANFELFLSDTAALSQAYLGSSGRLITWIETTIRNGYDARSVGFKTRSAYRGDSTNGLINANGNYPRANTILGLLNDL